MCSFIDSLFAKVLSFYINSLRKYSALSASGFFQVISNQASQKISEAIPINENIKPAQSMHCTGGSQSSDLFFGDHNDLLGHPTAVYLGPF